ncbi:GNAT family N-acetyltransferase [Clavibacter sp. CFBP 8614]|uniref:GNAT family N-acetyltransferase n=1 Tax=unclassified Clavibacter TaxID=2626594 RepID=UPI004041E22F
MDEHIEVVRHHDLSRTHLEQLRALFDREYLDGYGPWTLDAPYGYSPADMHLLVTHGSELVAHAAFRRRVIAVGEHDVAAGRTGGVLVSEHPRGGGLGRRLMSQLARPMRSTAGIEYGYLGCRPEVVPTYASSGWRCRESAGASDHDEVTRASDRGMAIETAVGLSSGARPVEPSRRALRRQGPRASWPSHSTRPAAHRA